MTIAAIVFDAVGTLIHPASPVAEVYHRIGQQHGCQRDAEQIWARFQQAVATHFVARAPGDGRSDEGRERACWQAVVADSLGDGHCDVHRAFQALWTHFGRSENWRLFDDVRPAWDRLAEGALTLAIASNFDARLPGVLGGLPPLDRCQHIYFSSDVGYAKPHRQFYRHVQQRLNLAPDQILFVGDDPVHDYQAPRAAGWHAVLVRRDLTSPQDAADPRSLGQLTELPDWV